MPARLSYPKIEIEPVKLADLYRRLVAGEKWKDLAQEAKCSDTGLKTCFQRAGYDTDLRTVRKNAHGKTRDIPAGGWNESRAGDMLRVSLRVSV